MNIVNLSWNEAIQEILKEKTVANPICGAAVDRIRPVLEQLSDQNQAKAFLALALQIASAVAKNG